MAEFTNTDNYIAQKLYTSGYRYITRNHEGVLYAHTHKPVKIDGLWYSRKNGRNGSYYKPIGHENNHQLFAMINVSDDQPTFIPALLEKAK